MTEFLALTRDKTSKALLAAAEVSSEFEEQGFSSTFGRFNAELLRPFQRFDQAAETSSTSTTTDDDDTSAADTTDTQAAKFPIPASLRASYAACAAFAATLSLRCCCNVTRTLCTNALSTLPNPFRPSTAASRKAKFVLWNVLCFWLGVVDLLVIFALKSELASTWAWLIALVDGLLGYLFAYTFYFVFVAYGSSLKWMLWGVGLVASYVALTAYLTYEGLRGPGDHIEAIEGVLNGCKAVANTVVLYHAATIVYKQHLGGTHFGAGRKGVGSSANLLEGGSGGAAEAPAPACAPAAAHATMAHGAAMV